MIPMRTVGRLLSLAVFLLSLAGSECTAETLPPGFASVLDAPRYQRSHWGILVADLETGKDLYEHNGHKLFGPASTTKLFTTAAGLDALGAGFCFETPVLRAGPVHDAGTLKGDLVSPRATVRLLRYMAGHPEFTAFHDALPILGVDGTLAHSVPPQSPARGKVHAKTGTILTGDLINERAVLNVKGLAG